MNDYLANREIQALHTLDDHPASTSELQNKIKQQAPKDKLFTLSFF